MQSSPLAPAAFPGLEDVRGVTLATHVAEIKYRGREDLMLAVLEPGTVAAGVYTQSMTAGAPVLVCRSHLDNDGPRALIVSSGNSNAFTGRTGMQHCEMICQSIADAIKCSPGQVFVASTGVIGELLPIAKITGSVPDLVRNLSNSTWLQAASAILTTDTFPKGATARVDIGGTEVVINGFAKGSGMIAPDMATMLAFCFTDANLPRDILQRLLEEANRETFNAITVDSDTSTSDTLMLFATGKASNPAPDSLDDEILVRFRAALKSLMLDLAQQVVRDGEGATKLIKVTVTGAENDEAAKIIARSVANSPLVKTAIAGEDANWGRIVMAVGKAGQKADRDRLEISMGGICITSDGEVVDGYDEDQVTQHLKQQEIIIDVDVGIANGKFTMWTCDLTHGYITINADYRS